VNIGNEVNILIEGPRVFYAIRLSFISKRILSKRGVKIEDIDKSDVTSTSKKLKRVFETNLGFNLHIGKKRSRVVVIPAEWVKKQYFPADPPTTWQLSNRSS